MMTKKRFARRLRQVGKGLLVVFLVLLHLSIKCPHPHQLKFSIQSSLFLFVIDRPKQRYTGKAAAG